MLAASGGTGLTIDIDSVGDTSDSYWTLQLRAPQGQALQPGTRYTGATRFSSATAPGIDIHGNGRGCNQTAGEFTIRELVLSPSNVVISLALDFEQHFPSFLTADRDDGEHVPAVGFEPFTLADEQRFSPWVIRRRRR